MNINISRPYLLLLLLPLVLGGLGGVTGCTGTHSFTTAARPGETIALAVGYRQRLQRNKMTVTIIDSSGAMTTYLPNDTRMRGVVNLYPDPVSKLMVGKDTGLALGVDALNLTSTIQGFQYPGGGSTSGDSDWWMTTVLLDLPTTMTKNGNTAPIATGQATIAIADTGGNIILPASVEILAGASSSNLFNIYGTAGGFAFDALTQYPNVLNGLERSKHSVVSFQTNKDQNGADIMPHSVEAMFTHTTGVGVPTVINPRSELKNVIWTDDGTNLKVMITPPNGATLINSIDLKFYIAGYITGLTQTSLKAYDINGSPITGVTATVTAQ